MSTFVRDIHKLILLREATFFFLSNVMVVLGMVTMDHAVALAQYDIVTSELPGRSLPSLGQIAWSYMAQKRKPLDVGFLDGLRAAVTELSRKSQSMYLGSAMFQDGLRVDLIFLSVNSSTHYQAFMEI
jgi:15-cis-phytoene synthase/lycopene beta-cyclase